MNNQIVELESRLEGQMNTEEIISTLTAKNLDLEEQNKYELNWGFLSNKWSKIIFRNLKLENYDLEQLHLMDEEMIDTWKETEKELQLKNEEQMIALTAVLNFCH